MEWITQSNKRAMREIPHLSFGTSVCRLQSRPGFEVLPKPIIVGPRMSDSELELTPWILPRSWRRLIPYAVLRNRIFLLYLIARFLASLGQQMLTVAVGWELYERTHSALALGLVGLTQMAP